MLSLVICIFKYSLILHLNMPRQPRYNPFWFDEAGNPTHKLIGAYVLVKKFIEDKDIDSNCLNYYVVGSNANGTWRSKGDAERISVLLAQDDRSPEDLEFLALFGKPLESKTYVSDLDFKVVCGNLSAEEVRKLKYLMDEFPPFPANDFFSGIIEVYTTTFVAIPYYSLSDRRWTR
jgi:hypothetical protein